MASFTDLIPQFNPYIQQLPVDAMVQVGMEKQKRYDEGIQKLQSQIDQVAGLNVLRPVDKAYLQSKVNELGNNLKNVAAGDFSNFQLVNSVGGMIGQISKDPYVMAAVKSTAIDQKNAEFMESERKAGKLDPANVHVYNLQRSKYINSGLRSEDGAPIVFSGQYEPYRNVYEKLSKIAKDVGVDETLVQNLFNPDGTLNKVMIETMSKGKDVNKIYDAFVNGLDAGDYRQLEINGIYKYKDRSPEDVISVLETSNKQYAATALDKKADIEDEIAKLKTDLVSAKPEEAVAIKSEISKRESLISKIDSNIAKSDEVLAQGRDRILSGDEDYLNLVRGKIYTDNFLTGLSKDFSEKISHVKYLDNPLVKAIMEENKFIFDKWYKREQLALDKRKVDADEMANKLKQLELFPLMQSTGSLPGDQVSLSDVINQQFLDKTGERNQMLVDLARWDMKRLGWNDDKINNWVKTQAKNRGQSEAEVLSTWGTTALTRINSGQVKPTSEVASQIDNLNNLNNLVNGFQQQIKASDEKARAEGGESVKNVPDILKATKPVTVNVGNRNITLSASDQLDLARWVSNRREIFSTRGEDKEREFAIKRLENKYGQLAPLLLGWGESQYAKTPTWTKSFLFGSPISTISKIVQGKGPGELTPFQQVLKSYTGSAYENFKGAQEKVYRETFSAFYPKNETFALTEKSRPIIQAKLSAMFIDRPDFADIKTKLDDPKSQVVVTVTPSLTGLGGESDLSLKVIGKEGAVTAAVPLSLEQYQDLFNKNPERPDPNLSLMNAIINGSPDKSSNRNGLGSVPTSFFSRNAFRYMTPEYNILGGDFVRSSDGQDVYFPKIYYVPRGTNDTIPVDIGVPMSLQDALSFPNMMDDNKFKQIISKK